MLLRTSKRPRLFGLQPRWPYAWIKDHPFAKDCVLFHTPGPNHDELLFAPQRKEFVESTSLERGGSGIVSSRLANAAFDHQAMNTVGASIPNAQSKEAYDEIRFTPWTYGSVQGSDAMTSNHGYCCGITTTAFSSNGTKRLQFGFFANSLYVMTAWDNGQQAWQPGWGASIGEKGIDFPQWGGASWDGGSVLAAAYGPLNDATTTSKAGATSLEAATSHYWRHMAGRPGGTYGFNGLGYFGHMHARYFEKDERDWMAEESNWWSWFDEYGRNVYFLPGAASGGFTTALGTKSITDQAQATGLINALASLAAAGHAGALGIISALDARTAAGQDAGTGLITALDSLTAQGYAPSTGLVTALESMTAEGLQASFPGLSDLTTVLASLSKSGSAAALGVITSLDALSVTERAQVLGLITSVGSETVTEFNAQVGGAGFTTTLAALSAAGLTAGVSLWQLGDAVKQAYNDLDAFFEMMGDDWDVEFDSLSGFAETVTVGAASLTGIFDDHSASGSSMEGPYVRLKTSDVDGQAIDQGTVVTIRGRTFHVAGIQRDGVGVSTCILREPL